MLGLVIVLLFGVSIAAQSSVVQTLLAAKAMEVLNGRINGKVHFSKIHVSPLDGVAIKDIAIIDDEPYNDGTHAVEDTLFSADYLTVTFSIRGLLGGNGLRLKRARIVNGLFVLVSEPGDSTKGSSNLQRIFSLHPSQKQKTKSDKDLLAVSRVDIEGMEFRMKNCRPSKLRPIPASAIDWKDMDVRDICLRGKQLRVSRGIISGTVESLGFTEKSGFSVKEISGKVETGNGVTSVGDFHLIDEYSELQFPSLSLYWPETKPFDDFVHEVRIEAEISPSKVDMRTVAYFAPALQKMSFLAEIEGAFNGYVCDFTLDPLTFRSLPDGMCGTVRGRLTGLPDSQAMMADASLYDFGFTSGKLGNFIKGFAPSFSMDMKSLAPGKEFHLEGKAKGPVNRLEAKLRLGSQIGEVQADVDMRNVLDPRRGLRIGGTVHTYALDLGEVLGKRELGECSLMASLAATLDKGNPQLTLDTLIVNKLMAHGHVYSGISASGFYSKDDFRGQLSSDDPALGLELKASHMKTNDYGDSNYQFTAELSRADLLALNLYGDELSTLSLTADGFVNETADGGFNGDVQINEIILQDKNGLHKIGDMLLTTFTQDSLNTVTLQSDVLNGIFAGTGKPQQFVKDYINLSIRQELPSIFGQGEYNWSGNEYSLELKLNNSRDLLNFFVPGVYIADGTSVKLEIDKSGGISGLLDSDRLAYKNKYLKDVSISLDNRNHVSSVVLKSGEMSFSPILTRDNRLMLTAHDDSFGLNFVYDNQTELENRGEIFISAQSERDENDSLRIAARILESKIYLNSAQWSLKPSELRFGGGRIAVKNLTLTNGSQKLGLDGGYSKIYRDSLELNMEKFKLSALNPLLGGKVEIGGIATGRVSLGTPMGKEFRLLAGLQADSTLIAGRDAGTVTIGSAWNEEKNGFDVSLRNSLDGRSSINARALYLPADKSIDGRIGLDRLDLGYASPFLEGLFSEFGGGLSGRVSVSGPISSLGLESNGLYLDKAFMTLDFTKVEYGVSGPLHLDEKGLWFDNDSVSDRFGQTGSINGGIGWNHLKDINLQTEISFEEMEVLNTREVKGQAFYGNIFASGQARVDGPLNNLMLDVRASTAKNGNFHIPMASAANAKSADLLTFKEEEKVVEVDPYEEMMGMYTTARKSGNELGVMLKVNVDQRTQAYIEIDKASGNILSGRGSGTIDLEVRPSRDVFAINGNYDITTGSYHLDLLGIAKKDFTIQEGSTVRFNGDLMESDLDINALFKTKAAVGALIADTTATTRRTVECGLAITDKLKNPHIGFSINVPDLDPSTQSMVESALNTEDKIQKQFLSLLISGSFLPDERSGIVNNSNVLNTTVTEIMANQLNNILQKLDIPVDLGLDFQSGSNGRNVYDVAISTELFNNKVTVNGNLGNRMYGNSATGNDEFVGDLDIEIKMDRTGTLRFNLFSHSADQYTSYLDDSQRNGIGITYQKEFHKFREYFKNMFRPKKARKAAEAARQKELMDAERTVLKIEE